ncbi:MAG: helix-turn-helix domain-containing protein [Pseudomonadota bacterium]
MTAYGQSEIASCGLSIKPDHAIGRPTEFDQIVVIGPLLRQLQNVSPVVYDVLAAARANNIPITGVCTGSFVLAKAGLLDGSTACIHPYHALDFNDRFPGIRFVTDQHFVEENGLATVPGGTSVLNYAADLIERQLGFARSSKVMHQMSLPGTSWDIFGARQIRQRAENSGDIRLKKAISIMDRKMGSGDTVASVAAEVGLSTRQLDRLFRDHFGATPKRFWLDMRLDYCKWLTLNTRRPITSIALAGGFFDSAHLITQFKAAFGATPGEMREFTAGQQTV